MNQRENPKSKMLHASVSKSVHDKILAYAAKLDCGVSKLVCEAVELYLHEDGHIKYLELEIERAKKLKA